jgi:hypothetical protein
MTEERKTREKEGLGYEDLRFAWWLKLSLLFSGIWRSVVGYVDTDGMQEEHTPSVFSVEEWPLFYHEPAGVSEI